MPPVRWARMRLPQRAFGGPIPPRPKHVTRSEGSHRLPSLPGRGNRFAANLHNQPVLIGLLLFEGALLGVATIQCQISGREVKMRCEPSFAHDAGKCGLPTYREFTPSLHGVNRIIGTLERKIQTNMPQGPEASKERRVPEGFRATQNLPRSLRSTRCLPESRFPCP